MNRLVLIGNGFDLAHGLKTSYADFIDWYKEYRVRQLSLINSNISEDPLFTIKLKELKALSIYVSNALWFDKPDMSLKEYFEYIADNTHEFEATPSPLFNRILLGVNSKTWGGIEQDYYDLLKEYAFRDPNANSKEPPIKALNQQLRYLQQLLVEYLTEVCGKDIEKIDSIDNAIYAPINTADISVEGQQYMKEYVNDWIDKRQASLPYRKELFGIVPYGYLDEVEEYKKNPKVYLRANNDYPLLCRLPDSIMLLNFNYTSTARKYQRSAIATINPIHGELDDPKSIIFGYGDELDDKFKELKAHKNNACLSHVKSIKYLEAPNYRQMLSFIESEPFQVLIMGHSCGNSDRTLLNTIFEHPNCVSIKPYYYITDKKKGTDNYIELVQHISRNFNDMKLMRDRVVNKTQCEPLVKQ